MSIKVFNSLGNFLFNIGKLGNGKGEFIRIEDIEFYASHNSILVLCNSPTKIIEFSLDGHLIKETPIDFYATSFGIQSPNSFIFYVNQNKSKRSGNKNILITDSLFSVKERMFDMPKSITSTIKFSGGIFTIHNKLFFNPALSNTYYLIKNDTLLPWFRTEYGSRNIPNDIKENFILNNLSKYGYQYNTFVKTNNFIGFNYNRKRVMSAFYDLKSGNILTSDLEADSLNILFSNLMFQKNDTLISVLDLNRLSPFIERNKDKIQKRFPQFFQNIKIKDTNQNPVLMLYKIKPI